jgi:integrase
MTPDTQTLIPTYKVVSRHTTDCPHKDKGREYVQCNCKKHISVYDPRVSDPTKRQSIFPAKTRSWGAAEQIAQAHRDRHDPVKRALAEANATIHAQKAEKESKTVTIEKAVAMFIASKKAEGVSLSRIKRYFPLLGNIDPNRLTFVATRHNGRGGRGRLFEWLETLGPRPVHISDLTPVLVEEFRNTWNFPSDLTHRNTFGDLKGFFNYCVSKRWLETHPMAGMRAIRVRRGNRTTAFSDQQYESIVAAIKNRFPAEIKNLEDQKQHDDTHRLLAFVELMRWGGLALEDAVRFKLDSMKDNGEVLYHRVKTGKPATPTLLPHVVTLLKETVPIDGDLNQPFYDKNVVVSTNKNRWSTAVKETFLAAGINTVVTDIRDREPHCHMLRDTFAVDQLCTQYELNRIDHQGIADALGDTVAVFLKHYAPVIGKLEQTKRDAQRRIVEAQAAKWALRQKQGDKGKVKSIIGGRR